eukprot:1160414-Pelagomonas_calceolata.AAC.9
MKAARNCMFLPLAAAFFSARFFLSSLKVPLSLETASDSVLAYCILCVDAGSETCACMLFSAHTRQGAHNTGAVAFPSTQPPPLHIPWACQRTGSLASSAAHWWRPQCP